MGALSCELFVTGMCLFWVLYILFWIGFLPVLEPDDYGDDLRISWNIKYILTLTALSLDCLITVLHLQLSARWFIVLWTDVVAAVGYAALVFTAMRR
eukprot:3446617-Heterocapsa_arctica.AAC.1